MALPASQSMVINFKFAMAIWPTMDKIVIPKNSTLKIKHEGSSIFTYVDDKLVQELQIDE